MKQLIIKQSLTLVFILLVCHKVFSQVPLVTMQIDNQIKENFHLSMLYLSENTDTTFVAGGGDTSYFGPLGAYLFNISALQFRNINGIFSLPLFAGGALALHADSYGYSVSGGSGIIFKSPYFMLGAMAGVYVDGRYYVQGFDDGRDNNPRTIRPTFGLFPLFNTAKYPLLSYFLKKIDGFVYSNEPEINDTRIETLNYLLNISFRRFFALSVLELYTRNGINDVMIGYDLSNFSMEIENKSLNNIGNTFTVTDSPDARGYKTIGYGLRIGGERLVADLNYLTIENLGDYKYPFGFNGFPSVTFNYSFEDTNKLSVWSEFIKWSGFFLRFSTLNLSGKPYIPDIGVTAKGKIMNATLVYSYPDHLGVAIRWIQ